MANSGVADGEPVTLAHDQPRVIFSAPPVLRPVVLAQPTDAELLAIASMQLVHAVVLLK